MILALHRNLILPNQESGVTWQFEGIDGERWA